MIILFRFTSSVFERLPVSFKMKIFPQASDAEEFQSSHTTKPHRMGFFASLTHCFTDNACLELSEEHGVTSPAHGHNQYAPLDDVRAANDTLHLQTRKPQWNREINHWVHNFGGRVKVPSNKNFLMTQTEAEEVMSVSQRFTLSVPRATSSAEESQTDRVCIRHGKVRNVRVCARFSFSMYLRFHYLSSCFTCDSFVLTILYLQCAANTYVLDFRAPVSALVAFAAVCATHAVKPLVNA